MGKKSSVKISAAKKSDLKKSAIKKSAIKKSAEKSPKKSAKKSSKKSIELKSPLQKVAKGKVLKGQKKGRGAGTRELASHSQETLLRAYLEMFRARKINERTIVLYKQNKSHFQIGCAGHEAIQVACAELLVPGSDWAFPYYRDMAFCGVLGMSNREFFLNSLNKAEDPNSGGRQMPSHFGHARLNIVSQSSPTGSQFLQAVGVAHGLSLKGQEDIVYVSCGEGTTAQGDFHEALNWACRRGLRVLFVVQDNGYAISVPVSDQVAGGDVAGMVSGYSGLSVYRTDGIDYLESHRVASEAIRGIRAGKGPALILASVVRLESHSISDNQRKYRSEDELESDELRDPLIRMRSLLYDVGVDEELLLRHEEKLYQEITADAEWAEAQPDPAPESFASHVYGASYPFPGSAEPASPSAGTGEEFFMVDAINRALVSEMRGDDTIVICGQDVAGGKGGVFTVTAGLTSLYGSDRVFNAPLAESSIIGTAIGMSLVGITPVVEIQFADFIWPAMNQLRNELAVMRYRSNGAFSCPVVVRVPVGGYIHGALYHSQNIEATFAHFPGLVVLYPSNATDAYGLLKSAIRCPDPVLFLEPKGLYRQVYAKGLIGGDDYQLPIGVAKCVRRGSDCTVVTWGSLVQKSLLAAEQLAKDGYDVEVLDLRSILPFDAEGVFESVRRTGRVLVASEDVQFMGFGAEVAAQIGEMCFRHLDAPVMRLGGGFTPIPHAPVLEERTLPQNEDVRGSLLALLRA